MNMRRMLLVLGLLAITAGMSTGGARPAEAQEKPEITLTGFRTMPPPDPKPDDPKKPKRAGVSECATALPYPVRVA